jgi:hypothetical protein
MRRTRGEMRCLRLRAAATRERALEGFFDADEWVERVGDFLVDFGDAGLVPAEAPAD